VKGPQTIKRHRLKFRLFHGCSTTFPIRVQDNILRIILRSTHLPSTTFAPFLLGQSAPGMTTGASRQRPCPAASSGCRSAIAARKFLRDSERAQVRSALPLSMLPNGQDQRLASVSSVAALELRKRGQFRCREVCKSSGLCWYGRRAPPPFRC
jgi:hypothetical protein